VFTTIHNIVLINARQVFELTIRFVLYSVFSTTTCESFDLYNTTTKFNFDFVFEGMIFKD